MCNAKLRTLVLRTEMLNHVSTICWFDKTCHLHKLDLSTLFIVTGFTISLQHLADQTSRSVNRNEKHRSAKKPTTQSTSQNPPLFKSTQARVKLPLSTLQQALQIHPAAAVIINLRLIPDSSPHALPRKIALALSAALIKAAVLQTADHKPLMLHLQNSNIASWSVQCDLLSHDQPGQIIDLLGIGPAIHQTQFI